MALFDSLHVFELCIFIVVGYIFSHVLYELMLKQTKHCLNVIYCLFV